MKIWADGFSNPKRCGYVVYDSKEAPLIITFNEKKTNNECEYEAVYAACRVCNIGDTISTDSQLVYNQIINGWKVNAEHLKEYIRLIKQLVKDKEINLIWEPRELNKAGVYIERYINA